jgi:hypothetical protein
MESFTKEFCTITLRNVPVKAKDTFTAFCANQGRSLHDVLRDYVCSVYYLNEDQTRYIMLDTVNKLLFTNPGLVDQFISEQEPLFKMLEEGWNKAAIRYNFVMVNPSYIYKRFTEWLNTQNSGTSGDTFIQTN